VLSLEKTAVRLFGPGGRLPGSSTKLKLIPTLIDFDVGILLFSDGAAQWDL
jgi:hypothetical protein